MSPSRPKGRQAETKLAHSSVVGGQVSMGRVLLNSRLDSWLPRKRCATTLASVPEPVAGGGFTAAAFVSSACQVWRRGPAHGQAPRRRVGHHRLRVFGPNCPLAPKVLKPCWVRNCWSLVTAAPDEPDFTTSSHPGATTGGALGVAFFSAA